MNAPAAIVDDRRQTAHTLLTQLLTQMDFSMRVESKDAEDGGIAFALHPQPPEVEQAGFAPGKRSPVLEALQFFVNKVVNPPTAQRRWVSVAVGEFPPPRVNGPESGRVPASPPAPKSPAPVRARPVEAAAEGPPTPGASPGSNRGMGRGATRGEPAGESARGAEPRPESRHEVAADPALSAVGKTLAQRSSTLGRFYAVLALTGDDRARLLQASQGVEGVSVVSEGEGRNRRLVYRPAKPAPVAKRVPDDDDEE